MVDKLYDGNMHCSKILYGRFWCEKVLTIVEVSHSNTVWNFHKINIRSEEGFGDCYKHSYIKPHEATYHWSGLRKK